MGALKDLRFYVSGVALIDAAGNYAPVVMTENASQGGNVALLDFEDGTNTCVGGTAGTYTAVTGKVAPGSYVGIAFTVGVPGKLNHSNIADVATPLPLQNSALNWSWQSGRKFTKIEFTANPVAPTAGVTTMVHLGATGCKANPLNGEVINGCGSPNRMQLSFASFNPTTQKIALDLGALFNGVDLTTSKTWMSAKPGGMMM
ncbi:MAG: MbnP family copper-binding protein, partial [Sulfuriferula sp.]